MMNFFRLALTVGDDNENAQRCAAKGFGSSKDATRRIRCSKNLGRMVNSSLPLCPAAPRQRTNCDQWNNAREQPVTKDSPTR